MSNAAEPNAEPQLTLDAADLAPRLGMTAEQFIALFKRGLIRQRVERGIGEDAGRFRVSLRYLGARAALIVDAEGAVLAQG